MTDLLADNVVVRFGERLALNEVSARFRSGEVAAIVGPNGSGKSTLIDVIAGIRLPDHGRVRVPGAVGLVRQRPAVDTLLTCRENLRFFARVQGVRSLDTDGLLADAGLGDRADERVGTLSGGMQRRVDLLRAISVSPRVLLLDEPTAGLDAESRSVFGDLVRRTTGERDIITVWITHAAEEAARADRVLRMTDGRLEETPGQSEPLAFRVTRDGSPAEVMDRDAARDALLGALDSVGRCSVEPAAEGAR